MRLYSKVYLVTYVTLKGEINSSVYGITQQEDESDDNFMNLSEGMIARRLLSTINNCTHNDCRAIINFWFIKGETIQI
jgi:hypothetical protein